MRKRTLAREEMIAKEILRPKQRVNAILYSVNREGRGAQLLLYAFLSLKC